MPDAVFSSQDVVLCASQVSKRFCRTLRRSMYYGALDVTKGVLGITPNTSRLRKGEFWAVSDVSLELRRGEALGIIGVNGSGKTTLLRLLSGIIPPDRGEIVSRGRIGALISLGAGFHPLMTGRENIYLNGILLGMNRREIDSKLDWIIDFSELEDFIDAPVSMYSSGMRVRLGFSIAVSVRPDILILDEVLAVGDRSFKAKCFNEMDRLAQETAIVLVSHQLRKIGRLCNCLVVLDRGSIVYHGENVMEGINFYCARFGVENSSESGSGKAEIRDVQLLHPESSDEGSHRIVTVEYGQDLIMDITLTLASDVKKAVMSLMIYDLEQQPIVSCQSDHSSFEIINTGEPQKVRIVIPKLELSPGTYSITLSLKGGKAGILTKRHAIQSFRVTGSFTTPAPLHLAADWSLQPCTASWSDDNCKLAEASTQRR